MNANDTSKPVPIADDEEMAAEYELDPSQAKPNRFAARLPRGHVVGVILDPDVAAVFDSSDSVNRFLRSAIEAMPNRRTKPLTSP